MMAFSVHAAFAQEEAPIILTAEIIVLPNGDRCVISGYICEENEIPVESIEVQIWDETGENKLGSSISDSNGYFYIEVAHCSPNNLTIQVPLYWWLEALGFEVCDDIIVIRIEEGCHHLEFFSGLLVFDICVPEITLFRVHIIPEFPFGTVIPIIAMFVAYGIILIRRRKVSA